MDVSKVTRLEVIGNNVGRMVTLHGVDVELALQDDGRTLKVFVKRTGQEADVVRAMTAGLTGWGMKSAP